MSIPEDDNPQQRLAYDRTLLANERTYAAWLRTGLAVAAFGFALMHFPDRPGAQTRILAGVLVLTGAVVIAHGGFRYRQVDRDLRAQSTRSVGTSTRLITIFTMLVSSLLVALLFLL